VRTPGTGKEYRCRGKPHRKETPGGKNPKTKFRLAKACSRTGSLCKRIPSRDFLKKTGPPPSERVSWKKNPFSPGGEELSKIGLLLGGGLGPGGGLLL